MKTISCRELGINCPWIGRAMSVDELMKKAAEHAMEKHAYFWDNRINILSRKELEKIMIPHIREE